ncbi:MAG: metalloprotease TldD [Gammaproteobacteria bacterium]|nr:metalloprotease TldD [Gammaproteobacteria bacterium]NNC67679.1 metalloprotease TldD [Gammaproteobacteria bacterium]
MHNPLELAKSSILDPSGLNESHLSQAFSTLLNSSADSGDIYFQMRKHEAWSLEDGIVKDASYNISQGVGIRAIKGEKSGFAYSDEILMPALLESCKAARAIARGNQEGQVQAWKANTGNQLYMPDNPLDSITEADKVNLLRSLDALARRQDDRIKQVMASIAGTHEIILVANSDGSMAADVRPLVRLNVSVIVENKGRLEQGSAGGGGRFGYDIFTQDNHAHSFVHEAVRMALLNLEAVEAPAGEMNVVLGPGWPGVLLHEAIGHGLEGDFTRKGTSAFSGRVGERVASKGVTVVDDGTLENRRGSLNIDDEGTTTQCTTLIEDGILKGFMQDKLNAKLSNTEPTGNGRRESYSHLPMPRMTNTYMLAGEHDPGEILSSVDSGFYAVNFGGGQVDITSGKFVFNASEAYLIEKGKVTKPVKGATLIGDGPDVLTRVSMIGNDLELDRGVGTCGKEGQSVPVGVGQPTLRIDGITVGGTSQ